METPAIPSGVEEVEYHVHERDFLRKLQPAYHPNVVFDIGASTGFWSEMISTVLPEASYELFEPLAAHPRYADDLSERLHRIKGLRLHRVALSDENSELDICVSTDLFGSSLRDRGDIPEITDRIRVKVCRLDDYVAQNHLPAANVVKMDCQGAENSIIRGGINTIAQADVLFIETWLKRGYGPDTPLLGEIIEMLRPLDFTIVEFGERFYDQQHRLYSVDAFFCSERLLRKLQPPIW